MRYVLKFGGSSLSTASKIKAVANFISYFMKTKADELIIVVSAMGKTTDALINIARKIDKNLDSDKLPEIVCQGERISCGMLALALCKINIKSEILPAEKVKIHAKGDKTKAILTRIDTAHILNALKTTKIVIVPGFQAVDDNGNLCMLSRGASDTTAVGLGAVLNAKVIIYTDVKGFYSFDPNQIKNAKPIEAISFKGAIELASCGAKIMEQNSLEIAHANDVELKVLKSQTDKGTSISANIKHNKIDAISVKSDLTFLSSSNRNFLQNIEKICKKAPKFLYFSQFSENGNTCFLGVIDNDLFTNKNNNIKTQKCEMITIVGCGLLNLENLKSYLYKTIEKLNIFTFYISISPTTIKIITKPNQSSVLAEQLHQDLIINNNYYEI